MKNLSEMKYILAPMAEYTDLPFRRACRLSGLYYAHTALIDAGALAHGNPDSDTILKRGEEEKYLAVQLLGSIPEDIQKAAKILNKMDFDSVDFNMGCPVKKVLQRKAGAALMLLPEQALECLKKIRDIISGPLTVKTRILSEIDPEPTISFCQALEACGIQGLTIHGRLAEKFYSGPVAFDIIRAIRENLKIPVTANGGIFNLKDAEELAQKTGCAQLMVARGAIGNPWIFRELIQQNPTKPTHQEICATMRQHVSDMITLYGEQRGLIKARKIILSYLVGRQYRRRLRAEAVHISTQEDFINFYNAVKEEGPVPTR